MIEIKNKINNTTIKIIIKIKYIYRLNRNNKYIFLNKRGNMYLKDSAIKLLPSQHYYTLLFNID